MTDDQIKAEALREAADIICDRYWPEPEADARVNVRAILRALNNEADRLDPDGAATVVLRPSTDGVT